MKRMNKKAALRRRVFGCMAMAAVCAMGIFGLNGANVPTAAAEGGAAMMEPIADTSPALYVAERNGMSVVGILTNTVAYNAGTMTESSTNVAQGSGVVIREGGYVLTNYHVIEDGEAYQILMPSGDKVDATIVGTDSSTDLAVLKVSDADVAASLVPVTTAAIDSVKVGSTVIAIGNPGGEVLANTVTQGIVSALERTSVNTTNTSRQISYIQHDAAINSGNSGGGLFNYKGELIGINTLKYSGSSRSSASFEGLGFAIPVDTVMKVANDLIDFGKVQRPGLGVTVSNYSGADEPLQTHGPASVMINSVTEGGAAEAAGLKQFDFITAVDGQRVTTMMELTAILDQHEIGDTVTVTVVRYNSIGYQEVQNNYNNGYGNYGYGNMFPFFGYGFGYGDGNGYGSMNNNTNTELVMGNGYETLDLQVTLQLLN